MSLATCARALALTLTALAPLQVASGQIGGGEGWFLQGKVTMEDGSIPTDKVSIESICSGQVRTETVVDKKGVFHFTLGANNAEMLQDATRSGRNAGGAKVATGLDSNTVAECAVRARLEGYRSDAVNLSSHKFGDSPEIGTIRLHKLALGEGPSLSSQQAPKDARKAFDKGAEALKAKKLDEAIKSFQKAVEVYPGYAEAFCEMGRAQAALNQTAEARKSFQSAIQADAKYAPVYLLSASLETQAKDWKALAEVTAKGLAVAPSANLYLFNAVANYSLQDYAAAEKASTEGVKVDSQHQAPKLYQVLGSVLARKGDFAGAATQFKHYLEFAPSAPDAANVRTQIAELESRAGQSKP
jgi:tetratricopeptide (TPR) repeat protein